VSAPTYLLDTYTGAAAAYSLRQLATGVTNVVRVRRSSDNSEDDFTPTEIIDGTLTTWVGAGNDGFVTTAYDQSGNGKDLTNATAANQPQIVSSGALITDGGLPAIDARGTTTTELFNTSFSLDLGVKNTHQKQVFVYV
jgi:hypothetical protein